jgi:hypothetical protein
MFCTMELPPIQYASLETCKQQGVIVGGIMKVKAELPQGFIHKTVIECVSETVEAKAFVLKGF